MKRSHNIAIIGAGMAGIAAARVLVQADHRVIMFDKGRQPGGRLATRKTAGFTFNHGCQFFTSRDAGFAAATRPASAPWPATGADRQAGVPDMAALAAAMLPASVEPRQRAAVSSLARQDDGWRLQLADAATGPFDAVILTIPAPQAAALLAPSGHSFAGLLATVEFAPCWALMLGFAGAAEGPAVIRDSGAIAWTARENSRPGRRPDPVAYTVHATPEWSGAHLQDDADQVIAALSRDFAAAVGIAAAPVFFGAHRWRYAKVSRALGRPFLWDCAQRVGICGDWCLGGRLEAAYLSGHALGIYLAHDL